MRIKWSIDAVRELATRHKGELLSKQIAGTKDKYLWRCCNQHEWESSLSNGARGTWCIKCSKARPRVWSEEKCRELARKKGGDFLSIGIPINSTHYYKWRCAEGHEWSATLSSVASGTWCMKERALPTGNKPWNFKRCQDLALKNGGSLLSDTFIGKTIKLHWRCSRGHKWYTTPATVNTGHWCPYCSSGLGEKITRRVLELILGFPLPLSRPDWLKLIPKRKGLELDGYNDEHKVAFEYDGLQHYQPSLYLDKTGDRFYRQIQRDHDKNRVCNSRGINLVRIKQHRKLDADYVFNRCMHAVHLAGLKPVVTQLSTEQAKIFNNR